MRSEYLLAKSLYMLVKATQDPIFKLVLSPVFPEDVPIQFSSFWAKKTTKTCLIGQVYGTRFCSLPESAKGFPNPSSSSSL